MFKIAKSLVMVFAVAVIGVSATGAYFNDQVLIAGNTFSAGKVNLEVRGAGSNPQSFTAMAPGVWTAPIEYDVYNLADSLPVKYKFQDSMTSESYAGFYDKINVRVRHTFAGTANPATWPVRYEGPLKDLMIDSTVSGNTIASILGTNITHVFYLEFQLDPSADNALQGKTASFGLVFDATQADNPGWTE